MENRENSGKEMIKKENNLFFKIKSFFKNIFSKKKDEAPANEKDNTEKNPDWFMETSLDEAVKLREEIEKGNMQLEDLTNEQIELLQRYYDEQIREKQIRLMELQQKLLKYQKS